MNHRLGAAAVVAVSFVAALGSRQPTPGAYLVFGVGLSLMNLLVYAGLAATYHAVRGARRELRGDGDGEAGDGGERDDDGGERDDGGDETGDGGDGNRGDGGGDGDRVDGGGEVDGGEADAG